MGAQKKNKKSLSKENFPWWKPALRDFLEEPKV